IDQHEFRRIIPFIDVFPANSTHAFLHAHFLAHHDTMWLYAQTDTFNFLYRKFIHLAFNIPFQTESTDQVIQDYTDNRHPADDSRVVLDQDNSQNRQGNNSTHDQPGFHANFIGTTPDHQLSMTLLSF